MSGPHRREQVFVSSTYTDLQEERQEVISTLLEADCIPSGMELFPASDDDSWTLIKRVIDDCDYYVVVIGGRYGSMHDDLQLSFTEMEFDYATETGKPIMAFLHGAPESIPAGKSELGDDARARLEAFREKAQSRLVKFWTSPAELGAHVAKSLIQIRRSHPAEGWVRARDAVNPELEAENADLRAQVAELTARMQTMQEQATTALEIGDLAGGEDPYEFFFNVAWRPTGGGPVKRDLHNTTTTWNAFFTRLGPLMVDEASEAVLEKRLSTAAPEIVILGDALPEVDGKVTEVIPFGDVLHDLLVQWLALGLIDNSERRRPVSDTDTYWSLTPQGRSHLMRTRAVRRPRRDGDDAPPEASTAPAEERTGD